MLKSIAKAEFNRIVDERETIDRILEEVRNPDRRVVALTDALRAACPQAAVYACALTRGGERHAHAVNGSGIVCPNWRAEVLEMTARAGSPKRPRPARKTASASLARQSGVVLKVQNIEFRREFMGVVAIGLDASSRSWTPASIEATLRGFAAHLGASLYIEWHMADSARENSDVESLCGLAKIGELIDPVAHEVNNFLNAALLHMAVMQSKLPADSRDDLNEIRHQGERLTEMIRQLQQYRRVDRREERPIDLNSVVCASVEEIRPRTPIADQRFNGRNWPGAPGEDFCSTTRNGVPVRLALSPKLPLITGATTDVQYLCSFLLKNAAGAAARSGGDILIRTEAAAGNVSLQVNDSGPAIAPELLPRLFDPSVACRDGTNSLELAACKSLVKRLKGKIHGMNRPGGGVSIQVDLPAACV
jgi:signal transduction histidine kinase